MSSVDDPRKGYALGADAYLAEAGQRAALLDELNRLTRARILVIDDDPAARYAIRKYCERQPYQVLEAADAREGLRAARTLRPELIVLDLNLPDRRGEEVLRELASAEATSAHPRRDRDLGDACRAEARERLRGAAAVFSKAELTARVVRKAARIAAPPGQRRTAMTAQTILNVDDNTAEPLHPKSRALREARVRGHRGGHRRSAALDGVARTCPTWCCST